MKELSVPFILIISLSILISCNSKKETPPPQTDIISETPVVKQEQPAPKQSWKEQLSAVNEISTEKDINTIKAIIEKAVREENLDELQEYLETEAEKDKVPPQILFGLSLVYGRKGLVKEEYKIIEKLEEQVKQRPGIAFNLSLVYGRKDTLKSQIDKAEAEALALLKGYIAVKSIPEGADVYLDGELKGTTPFTTKGLDEGSYAVEIRMEDYTDISKTTSVKAGETTGISEELVLMPGSLVINSDPIGSTVLLAGEKIGITPLEISEIEAGEYELTISKENYNTNTISAKIKPADITNINTSLEALTGILSINDLTDSALVYLDGKRVFPLNSTSMQRKVLKNIQVGKHELTIKKNNFIEKNIVIVINSGQLTMTSGILEQNIFEIPFANIKVDGKLEDWNNITPVALDPKNDSLSNLDNQDIIAVSFAKDDKYLYIRVDVVNSRPKASGDDETYDLVYNIDNKHYELWCLKKGLGTAINVMENGRETGRWDFGSLCKTTNGALEARFPLNKLKENITDPLTIKPTFCIRKGGSLYDDCNIEQISF